MIKVVVVGFGFMGITHTANILKIKNLKLVAIVNRDINGIEKKLSRDDGNFSTGEIDPEQLREVNKYANLTDCIRNEEFDSVHICVHTNLHFELTKEALQAGKHVFLEKPFCLDTNEGNELITLAEDKKRTLMVGHVLRFMPPYEQLKEWIDSEKYGKLKFLSLTRFSGVPGWGQWKEKQENFGSSGGALFDLLIHDIDYIHYLFGEPIDIESTYFAGLLSKHDYISAWWNYQEFKVKVEGGNTFHSSFPFQAGFMAEFENASILYNTNDPDHIQISDDTENNPFTLKEGDGFYNEIKYFYQCLDAGMKPELCMPESALKTIELCYQHL